MEKIADYRLVFSKGKWVFAVSRISAKGSYYTNIHKGASSILLEKKEMPVSIVKIADKVAGELNFFGDTLYSADFFISEDSKPVLVEINTCPGFFDMTEYPKSKHYLQHPFYDGVLSFVN